MAAITSQCRNIATPRVFDATTLSGRPISCIANNALLEALSHSHARKGQAMGIADKRRILRALKS